MNRMKVRVRAMVAGGTALALGMLGLTIPSTSGAVVQPITIGVIQNLTGASGSYGVTVLDGMKLALAQINAAGGVNHKKLKFIVQDSASDDAQTAALVPKLAANKKVIALMAPVYTGNYIAGAPVANKDKILWFTSGGGIAANSKGAIDAYPGQSSPYPYSFNLADPYGVMVGGSIKAILPKLNATSVDIIEESDNPAETLTTSLATPVLQQLGIKLTNTIQIPTGTTVFSSQVSQIVADNPSVVMVNLTETDGVTFMKQARAGGVTATFVSPNNGLLAANTYSLSGGAANGLIAPNQVPVGHGAGLTFAKFKRQFIKKYGTGPDPTEASYGYDAVYLLAKALSGLKTPAQLTRVGVRKSMAKITSFKGVNGVYSNDKAGDFSLTHVYPVKLTSTGWVNYTG